MNLPPKDQAFENKTVLVTSLISGEMMRWKTKLGATFGLNTEEIWCASPQLSEKRLAGDQALADINFIVVGPMTPIRDNTDGCWGNLLDNTPDAERCLIVFIVLSCQNPTEVKFQLKPNEVMIVEQSDGTLSESDSKSILGAIEDRFKPRRDLRAEVEAIACSLL